MQTITDDAGPGQVTLRAAQVLSLLLALPMTVGSVMFTLIIPDRHHAAWVTWAFAPIACAIGVGLLLTAPRMASQLPAVRDRLLRLLAAAAVFSLVKLTVFQETEAIPFLVLAGLAFALLVPRRPSATPHLAA